MDNEEFWEQEVDDNEFKLNKKPKVKKANKPKEKVILPISDWDDLGYLTDRIQKRYGATLKIKSKNEIIFEGENFIVELRKI